MPKLLESLKVKVIEYSDLRISGADALAERVGEGERLCFMRAVAALQEYFARNDEQLYKSIQAFLPIPVESKWPSPGFGLGKRQ